MDRLEVGDSVVLDPAVFKTGNTVSKLTPTSFKQFKIKKIVVSKNGTTIAYLDNPYGFTRNGVAYWALNIGFCLKKNLDSLNSFYNEFYSR